jgi:hypothetical protein
VETVTAIDCEILRHVWQELDYSIDVCCITKGGYIKHLYGRTETWNVSPSVDMLPPIMTIPATVPQSSESPGVLMNYSVYMISLRSCKYSCLPYGIRQARRQTNEEEIIAKMGRPSGKDGSQCECVTKRDSSLPRSDGGLFGE